MKKGIILLLLVVFSSVYAQETEEHRMKAAFLYHFTKYVEWPINKRNGEFIICIYGDKLTYKNLSEKTRGKRIGNYDYIKVVYVDEYYNIPNCHIIFVGEEYKNELEAISQKARKQNMLLVTDAKYGCKYGASIEFIFNKDRLGFKLNTIQIELSKLSISNQLVGMSTR